MERSLGWSWSISMSVLLVVLVVSLGLRWLRLWVFLPFIVFGSCCRLLVVVKLTDRLR